MIRFFVQKLSHGVQARENQTSRSESILYHSEKSLKYTIPLELIWVAIKQSTTVRVISLLKKGHRIIPIVAISIFINDLNL